MSSSIKNLLPTEMGIRSGKMSTSQQEPKIFEPVETFQFHAAFPEETANGLYFNDFYLPEEIVTIILSHIPPKHTLKATLVCKKWCNIIKSEPFWAAIYARKYNKKPKKLPWYVYYCFMSTNYFDTNLIKNGNGEKKFKHWNIIYNYGDAFRIEDPPCGSEPLPPNVPEFHGKTSCFATSYYECNKQQEISLENNRLIQLILDRFRPHIYLSEWVAGRFDCGCVYTLWCKLYGTKKKPNDGTPPDSDDDEMEEHLLSLSKTGTRVEQWAGSTWTKVELIVKDYPPGVKTIVFQHEGKDTQFWKGHYGSKMAGGVLKILFDTIEPIS